LDWLRNNAQFQQLRQVVQQQPQMLEPILQSVGAGNPQLAQLIGQHPDQFLQLLGEEADDGDALAPPGTQQISVTQEEQDAIERVSSSQSLSKIIRRQRLTSLSFVALGLTVISLFKPTLHVTRTKSSPPTFSSNNPMRTMHKIKTRHHGLRSFSFSALVWNFCDTDINWDIRFFCSLHEYMHAAGNAVLWMD
jgi:hypothetical protein